VEYRALLADDTTQFVEYRALLMSVGLILWSVGFFLWQNVGPSFYPPHSAKRALYSIYPTFCQKSVGLLCWIE